MNLDNEHWRDLYKKETGKDFVRSPMTPFEPMPMGQVLKALAFYLAPVVALFAAALLLLK